ncbi:MAG: threonine synthase [Candidatus Omnitrophica bacterium]|nr:threonine synthase [Candidatus Omnitrophota bacterium]
MYKEWKGVIDHYKDYLPISANTTIVTLREGGTPLIEASKLEKRIGPRCRLFLKFEGLNPTGSFKDRGMTLAVSKALEEGAKAVICASTGNTSASAAAYAARASMKAVVLVPNAAVALGKLAQALIHGAKMITIDGNFDDALRLVRDISRDYPVTLVNSVNPYRIEGQKTGAFEICDQLGGVSPDFHAIPVGNAGNITAYWKGYREYFQHKKIDRLPKMLGFQAEGAAPIVRGKPIANPQTLATAIKIGNPASWQSAVEAQKESEGLIDTVTDEEIVRAYQLLAAEEGVFVEPASAASVAGVLKLAQKGWFPERPFTCVCILTGHGLKDPERAIKTISHDATPCAPTVKDVLKRIGL